MPRFSNLVVAAFAATLVAAEPQLGAAVIDIATYTYAPSASPNYTWIFQYPMPIPPIAVPRISKNVAGVPVQYFEFTIEHFSKNIYPNLANTTLIGYNGISPGPMVKIARNTRSICRFTNNGDLSATVHLHGSWTRSPWDGWADNVMQPGQFKDYFYPNSQSARSLWYHDHANGHTSVDAYFGQNGAYLITDSAEDALRLPTGDYDIPIMLIDKIYDTTGQLVSPAGDTVNFFGDIIHANGQPWPYIPVEPRKYRFRMLNAALSRPFQIYLSQDTTGSTIDFQVIASDGGLLSGPVTTTTLDIGMGERYEIVIDFSSYKGQNITMMNSLDLDTIVNYINTDKILRFVVGRNVTSTANNKVPNALSTISYPPARSTVDHIFNFEHNAVNWTINGVVYDDVAARVLARPPEGTVETWQFNYLSGPGVHPIHVHLVDFQVISRVGGRGAVLPYESAGLKDVVLMAPGESIKVTAIYGPWNGLYQFHCHNLIHEDHEMMDVFNVTASPILQKLGYNNLLAFDDPQDPRFLPQDYNAAYYDLGYITNTLLPKYINLGAYSQQTRVQNILSSYYQTAPYGESSSMYTTVSSWTQTWHTQISQPHYTYPATFKALVAVTTVVNSNAASSTSTPTSSTTGKKNKSTSTSTPASTTVASSSSSLSSSGVGPTITATPLLKRAPAQDMVVEEIAKLRPRRRYEAV